MVYQGVEIEGARELRRQLKAAGDDLEDMKDLHHKVGSIVAAQAKILAPRSPDSKHIADTTRASKTKTHATVKVGGKAMPYAGAIHWGWFNRPNPERGVRGGPIKPRLWVSRAAQGTESIWFKEYEEYVDKALNRVKGKK